MGEQSKQIKNHKSKSKIVSNKRSEPNIFQKLFDTCNQVFGKGEAGFVPPPPDIQRLRLLLDNIKPEDLNLAPTMPYFGRAQNQETPPITYLHIYQCHNFSIGIFCLPQYGVIPLHNHPGMTVFSKLLFGKMHIKSYDWVSDQLPSTTIINGNSLSQQPELRQAKICVDADFTAPCNTSILYPATGGNMHCFTALTPCAVLDVLGPPYSGPDGRDCTYYEDVPWSTFPELLGEGEEEGYAWLKEREKPEDFVLLGDIYRRPRLIKR